MQDPMYSSLSTLHLYLSSSPPNSYVVGSVIIPLSLTVRAVNLSATSYLSHSTCSPARCSLDLHNWPFSFLILFLLFFFFFFFFLFVAVPLRLSRPVQYTKLATRVNASYRKASHYPLSLAQYSALLPSASVFVNGCLRAWAFAPQWTKLLAFAR